MRHVIKQAVFLMFAILIFPITLLFFGISLFFAKDEVLSSFSQGLSLIPGKVGCFLRAGFYRFTLTHCHPNARISFLVLLSQHDTELHEGCYVGPQCNIGRCSIGKNTLLGSGVHIMSGKKQHNFSDSSKPIKEQGGVFEKVSIGENCWLGNGSLIMANIGDNSIVAAGSVVIEDVPPMSIVAGNPAKVVKTRLD
ncbi:acyltransferase [Alteromonas sediminis]|uniref:Acyltransferase n=1 Tax=Alteromonas sediminis TaxID=2259342 RepID=A0A3N5Z5T5_9ALTE|nr:acyltransferase [Alteromonas sediminis]RPJ65734.1 acyltransferase [Alteromonas sediminis]